MRLSPWRGFNRLFLVLTVAWAIWCAVVYPLQMEWERQREAVSKYDKDVKTCQEIYVRHPDYRSMDDCNRLAQVNETGALEFWSFKHFWYWDVAFWQGEIPAIVLPPLLVYALGMVGRWVWRGFRPSIVGDKSA